VTFPPTSNNDNYNSIFRNSFVKQGAPSDVYVVTAVHDVCVCVCVCVCISFKRLDSPSSPVPYEAPSESVREASSATTWPGFVKFACPH